MEPVPSPKNLDILYNSKEMSVNASGMQLGEKVKPIGKDDLNFILKHASGGKLLDIGCGVGGFVLQSNQFFESEGLEINQSHAEIGQKNGLKVHKAYSGDFEGKEVYDVVSLLQVIEHLYNPKNVIQDAHRLLKKDGKLYIACPEF